MQIWKNHGTKVLGYVVAGLGAIDANAENIKKLLPDTGDTVFDILVGILSYVFIGAGAAIVFRGYQNSAATADQEEPVDNSKTLPMWLGLLLVCLFFAGSVRAAPPSCYPWDSAASNTDLSTQPSNVLSFLAADPAKASFVVTWWCDEKYQWKGYGFHGYKNELVSDWEAKLASLRNATKAQRDAMWNQYLTAPTPQPELREISQRQFDASVPLPIKWRVRDNPTSTSRPTFPVVNGVRSLTAAAERVSDSAPCACYATAIEESGGTYCSVSGSENVATTAVDQIPAARIALCYRDGN